MNDFSIMMGIVDFLNPVLYSCFLVCLLHNIKNTVKLRHYITFVIGAAISIGAGLCIPIIKVLVGMDRMDFELPTGIVAVVCVGFFVSGIALFLGTMKKNYSDKAYAVVGAPVFNFNTFVVLFGAAGIILIYISMIKIAFRKKRKAAMVFAIIPVVCTTFLCGVSAMADLYNPIVHWTIQFTNIFAQASLLTSAILSFKKSGQKETQ